MLQKVPVYPRLHEQLETPVLIFVEQTPRLHGLGLQDFGAVALVVVHVPGFFVSVLFISMLQKAELQQVVQTGVVAKSAHNRLDAAVRQSVAATQPFVM